MVIITGIKILKITCNLMTYLMHEINLLNFEIHVRMYNVYLWMIKLFSKSNRFHATRFILLLNYSRLSHRRFGGSVGNSKVYIQMKWRTPKGNTYFRPYPSRRTHLPLTLRYGLIIFEENLPTTSIRTDTYIHSLIFNTHKNIFIPFSPVLYIYKHI